jgi:hypothetical protein
MLIISPTQGCLILGFGPDPIGSVQPIPPPAGPIPPYPGVPPPSTVFEMINAQQSGRITPGHLAAWVTDNVLADAGVQFNNAYGKFVSTVQNVNFNAGNTDTVIPINLPLGYTRYRVEQIFISGASASIATATCGVFTAAGAGGVSIVTAGTAITVNQTGSDVPNNMQSLPVNNSLTQYFIDGVLYFRVGTAQGAPATASVSVYYQPLP